MVLMNSYFGMKWIYLCIALEERTVSKMARYAVEHIWEGKKEYFLIRDHQSWQMVLLPSKYLTHLIRANRSPNTVGRRAKSIRFYLEYLNETELELSQVAEQEFQGNNMNIMWELLALG